VKQAEKMLSLESYLSIVTLPNPESSDPLDVIPKPAFNGSLWSLGSRVATREFMEFFSMFLQTATYLYDESEYLSHTTAVQYFRNLKNAIHKKHPSVKEFDVTNADNIKYFSKVEKDLEIAVQRNASDDNRIASESDRLGAISSHYHSLGTPEAMMMILYTLLTKTGRRVLKPSGIYNIVYGPRGVAIGKPGFIKINVTSAHSKDDLIQQITTKVLKYAASLDIDSLINSIKKCSIIPTIIFDVERGGEKDHDRVIDA
jgi:hypothetical protein